MTLTFVDSSVLIIAARGSDPLALQALAILDDPDREFASSDFVKLEVLPKARFNKRTDEVAFYETFFAAVHHWPDSLERIFKGSRSRSHRERHRSDGCPAHCSGHPGRRR